MLELRLCIQDLPLVVFVNWLYYAQSVWHGTAWDFFLKKNDKHGSEYDEQERAAQHNIRIIHVELDFEN